MARVESREIPGDERSRFKKNIREEVVWRNSTKKADLPPRCAWHWHHKWIEFVGSLLFRIWFLLREGLFLFSHFLEEQDAKEVLQKLALIVITVFIATIIIIIMIVFIIVVVVVVVTSSLAMAVVIKLKTAKQ